MGRYIDADEFMSKFVNEFWSAEILFSSVDDIVEKLVKKAGDVAPVIHARWEADPDNLFGDLCICSNCKEKIFDMDADCISFCPYCGAKMDKDLIQEQTDE